MFTQVWAYRTGSSHLNWSSRAHLSDQRDKLQSNFSPQIVLFTFLGHLSCSVFLSIFIATEVPNVNCDVSIVCNISLWSVRRKIFASKIRTCDFTKFPPYCLLDWGYRTFLTYQGIFDEIGSEINLVSTYWLHFLGVWSRYRACFLEWGFLLACSHGSKETEY